MNMKRATEKMGDDEVGNFAFQRTINDHSIQKCCSSEAAAS